MRDSGGSVKQEKSAMPFKIKLRLVQGKWVHDDAAAPPTPTSASDGDASEGSWGGLISPVTPSLLHSLLLLPLPLLLFCRQVQMRHLTPQRSWWMMTTTMMAPRMGLVRHQHNPLLFLLLLLLLLKSPTPTIKPRWPCFVSRTMGKRKSARARLPPRGSCAGTTSALTRGVMPGTTSRPHPTARRRRTSSMVQLTTTHRLLIPTYDPK